MPSVTTRLEAVNIMLSLIGEAAVNSLDPDATEDVSMCERVLDETTKAVLAEGWHFNTEDDVELTPDASDEIVIPSDVISIDVEPVNSGGKHYVYRQGKLYNKSDNTFTITSTLKCRIVYFFDYSDCPEPFRRYILIRAARAFGDRVIGRSQGFDQQDEIRARADMTRADTRSSDSNYGNVYPLNRIIGRRSALGGLNYF